MSTLPLTIFFLGATGYVGGEVLRLLAADLPAFPVRALVRNVTLEKEAQLRALHPNIRIIEGTLDSDALIREEASKCDIVINTASSDHHASVLSTLAGLRTRSAANPANPPIYIHISGAGILEDNARGELLTPSHIWCDTSMDLRALKDVTHIVSDLEIVKAGTRVTMPIRLYINLAIQAGNAGTFGNGKNAMGEIHVKDVASAVSTCLKAALEDKADEGAEGLYFVLHPRMAVMKDIMTCVGNILHEKGVLKAPGCAPLPVRITDAWGEFGWALLGGTIWGHAERLKKLGWRPIHSEQSTLLASLQDEIELALVDLGGLKLPDYSDAVM
ncbi:hypothetical protein FB107DRAFT_287492 [Schizophyllum commune]